MKNLRFAILAFFLLVTIAFGQWYDFIGQLQFDPAAGTPAQSEGMTFYENVKKGLGFYDDANMTVLKDDAQKKNLLGNHIGDAEFYDSAVAPVNFTEVGSGSWTIDTTAGDQLEGTQTFRFSPGAANDTAYFPNIAVPEAVNQASINLGYSFRYKYSDADGDIEVRAVCVDDSSVLIGSSDEAILYANTYKATGVISVPKDCNVIKLGIEVVNYTASSTLDIDNIQVSDDPFVYKNLLTTDMIRLQTGNGHGSTNTKIRRLANYSCSNSGFAAVGATQSCGPITCTDSAASGTECTVNVTGVYNISYSEVVAGAGSGEFGISLNSTQLTTDIHIIAVADRLASGSSNNSFNGHNVSWEGKLEAGDILRPHTDSAASTSVPQANFTITATAEAEHVVHAEEKRDEWIDYTPTFNNLGTVTGVEGRYKRIGDTLHVRATFTTGTPAAALASMTLPAGLNIDGASLPRIGNNTAQQGTGVGLFSDSNSSAGRRGRVLTAPGSSTLLVYFGAPNISALDHLIPKNGSSIMVASKGVNVEFSVPIQGWSGANQYYVAVPSNTENVYSGKVDNPAGVAVMVNQNGGGITVSNPGGTGITTLDYSSLGLTVPPAISGSVNAGFSNFSIEFDLVTATTARVRTFTNAGAGTNQDYNFILQKQIPDYTAPSGVVSGKFQKVRTAYVKDVKTSGTAGGTFTSGAWRQRILNTLTGDTGFVSLASNVFTLEPGTYNIFCDTLAFKIGAHKLKLVQDPGGSPTDAIIGSGAKSGAADDSSSKISMMGRVSITADTDFEVQHRCQTTRATTGFGEATGFADEVYTQCKIEQVLAR